MKDQENEGTVSTSEGIRAVLRRIEKNDKRCPEMAQFRRG